MNLAISRRLAALDVGDSVSVPVREHREYEEEQQDNLIANPAVNNNDGICIGHISEIRLDEIYTPGIIGIDGGTSSSGGHAGARVETTISLYSNMTEKELLDSPMVRSCSGVLGEIVCFTQSYHPITSAPIKFAIAIRYLCEPGMNFTEKYLDALYHGEEPPEVPYGGSISSGGSSGPSISSRSSMSTPPAPSPGEESSSSSSSSIPSSSVSSSSVSSSSSSSSSSSGGNGARASPLEMPSNIDEIFEHSLREVMNRGVPPERDVDQVAMGQTQELSGERLPTLQELDADWYEGFPDDCELPVDGNHGVKEKESVWGYPVDYPILTIKMED